MFVKLIILTISLLALSAEAQIEPVQFKSIAAAKAWFSKSYPSYKEKKEVIKIIENKTTEVFSFYGTRGSGVIHIDGWYYSCGKNSICSLIGAVNLGRADRLSEVPTVTFESPNLIVKSGVNEVLKARVLE